MLYKPASPPMGWNSFDCYGWSADEKTFVSNVDFMAERLKPYGYEYCVLDFCWFYPEKGKIAPPNQIWNGDTPDVSLTLDAFGRPLPSPEKFPSCFGSFKPLADYVHSKGLRFGLHFMCGVPREAVVKRMPVKGASVSAADIVSGNDCDWLNLNCGIDPTKPGGREYIRSVVALAGEWQLDFIKLDDALRPYRKAEVECWAEEIDALPGKIVLSLSPGEPPLSEAESISENCAMWRVMDDLWDKPEHLGKITALAAKWNPCLGRGSYPDLDMLPLGRILYTDVKNGRKSRLSPRMKKYMLSLWCMAKSPLMIGSELGALSKKELELLTHPALTDILLRSRFNRPLPYNGKVYEWVSETETQVYYAAFNPSLNRFCPVVYSLPCGCVRAQEVFTKKRVKDHARFLLPPIGSVLISAEKITR